MGTLASAEIAQQLCRNFQKIFLNLNIGGRAAHKKGYIRTAAQRRILTFFSETDVLHVSTISHVLGISLQNANNLVGRLEASGYVQRAKNQDDRRLTDIRLTAKGKKWLLDDRREQVAILSRFLNELPEAEKKELTAAIHMAAVVLEKAGSQDDATT